MVKKAIKRKRSTTRTTTETIGQRIARLRKQQGVTQQEMAEALGLAQPNVSNYERGVLRLHGELLIKMADILGVSTDEILGLQPTHAKKNPAGGADRRFIKRLQKIDQLSKRDQQALIRTIDAFINKTN